MSDIDIFIILYLIVGAIGVVLFNAGVTVDKFINFSMFSFWAKIIGPFLIGAAIAFIVSWFLVTTGAYTA